MLQFSARLLRQPKSSSPVWRAREPNESQRHGRNATPPILRKHLSGDGERRFVFIILHRRPSRTHGNLFVFVRPTVAASAAAAAAHKSPARITVRTRTCAAAAERARFVQKYARALKNRMCVCGVCMLCASGRVYSVNIHAFTHSFRSSEAQAR